MPHLGSLCELVYPYRMLNRIKLVLMAALGLASVVAAWRSGSDFETLHRAAVLAAQGQAASALSLAPNLALTPFTLTWLMPLGFLPFTAAKMLWLLGQLMTLALFWSGMGKLYPQSRPAGSFLPWLFIFVLSVNPLHGQFMRGDLTLALFTVLLWAEIFSLSGGVLGGTVAGVLVAGAVATRIFPVWILAYYWLGRGRAERQGIIAGALLAVLSSYLVFGSQTSLLYFEFYKTLTIHTDTSLFQQWDSLQNVPAGVYRVLVASGKEAQAAVVTQYAFALCFALVSYLGFRRRQSYAFEGDQSRNLWALAMAMSALFCAEARPHYYMFYLPAIGGLLEQASLRRANGFSAVGPWVAVLAFTLTVGLTAESVVGKGWNHVLQAANIPLFGMGIVVLAGWAELSRCFLSDRILTNQRLLNMRHHGGI